MKKHEFMTRLANALHSPSSVCSASASTAPERTAANPYYPASFECKVFYRRN